MDAGAAQGRLSGGSGTVQRADAVGLIYALTGTGDQAHERILRSDFDLHLFCAGMLFLCPALIGRPKRGGFGTIV